MSNFSNIPTGLKITTQIPLDVKKYVKDEDTLAYLGVDDNLAYTYHDQLEVLCLAEKSIYIWREVQPGEENTGLIPLDFTYPLNLEDAYGINYSGKKYNFFLKQVLTFEEFNNLVIIKNVGNEIGIYKDSTINNNQIEFNFKTLTSSDNSVLLTELTNTINLQSKIYIEQGSNITITGDGTELNPFIINSEGGDSNISIENGATTVVNGDGIIVPYSVEVLNLQKEITTSYTLQASDHLHTIFLTPTSEMMITIPETGLPNNFVVGFYHVSPPGEYSIFFEVENALTQELRVPSGFIATMNTDGNFSCMIERRLATQEYMLNGDLKTL